MGKPSYFLLNSELEEHCYSEKYFQNYMKENDIQEISVHKAIRQYGEDFFYCREFGGVGEKGECGKQCEKYEPRNGKNGICMHVRPTYEPEEKETILKRKN